MTNDKVVKNVENSVKNEKTREIDGETKLTSFDRSKKTFTYKMADEEMKLADDSPR